MHAGMSVTSRLARALAEAPVAVPSPSSPVGALRKVGLAEFARRRRIRRCASERAIAIDHTGYTYLGGILSYSPMIC
jgi:hypothetical protein